jgi:hypothetical protein
MKKLLVSFLVMLFLISSCTKKCSNGQCPCKQWYEGTDCSTPMSQKFVGSFAGTLYKNGINPRPDTFTFTNLNVNKLFPNMAFLPDYGDPIGADTSLGLIILTGSTEGNCYQDYITMSIDKPINCGVCQISRDGRSLSFSYSPLIIYSDVPDSSIIYTFIGAKL